MGMVKLKNLKILQDLKAELQAAEVRKRCADFDREEEARLRKMAAAKGVATKRERSEVGQKLDAYFKAMGYRKEG